MFQKIARLLKLRFSISILLATIIPLKAHAVFIDFDDIAAPPAYPFDCDGIEYCGLILSNEYESKGVKFLGYSSWLIGGTLPDGKNLNGVRGINSIGLEFVGELPNFVSLNIDSPYQAEASYFYVYGEDGELLFLHISSGWRGTEETSTPYIPSELVEIYSSSRIKNIDIFSLFNLRVGPWMDNLTFEYREVNEPSILLLLVMGLAGYFLRRIHRKDSPGGSRHDW